MININLMTKQVSRSLYYMRYRDRHPEKLREQWQKNNQRPTRKEAQRKYQASTKCRKTVSTWEANNPSKRLEYQRRHHYGVGSPEHFHKQLTEQGNVCAICQSSFAEATPHLDHNHTSNQLRGVLCGNCNRGIGIFKDSTDTISNAVEYLRKWNNL